VTGATDGIGLGFCEILTQLGFNVVLISRNPKKLEDTVENLKKYRPTNSQTEFKTIAFDFKDSSDSTKFKALITEL
jgi:17beta-estradiol 17-dehydrogenase / very-long-chain 3-oxoacyl-CoA reductase